MKSFLTLFTLLFLVSCASKKHVPVSQHEFYPVNESPASIK